MNEMKTFMDESFLLSNETAKTLYHDYAAKMPIIDYHCHVNPQEIAEDKKAENLTQLWLDGDHYKWRLMRACGIPEEEITGSADDKTKFMRFAETLAKAAGNPVYHWAHLELKRYFGYDGVLNPQTAEEVWRLTGEKLKDMSVRSIIGQSGVEVIVTTDDPADDLRWHRALAQDSSFSVRVLPGWRPDQAIHIEKPGFPAYLRTLSEASGVSIGSAATLREALSQRMDFFAQLGCAVSDHGLDHIGYAPAADSEIETIFARRLAGEELTVQDTEKFQYALLIFLGREYHKRGWVMQIHYGPVRGSNGRMTERLGPDTGFDCMGNGGSSHAITAFLNALECTGELPKTVLYSLNPADDLMLETIAGCFQEAGIAGKVQHGAAWWFNDTKDGMRRQLTACASASLLGNFIGMLTDSRSFLSYTRHEYFRRILCDVIGSWAENGELPADIPALGQLVCDISYGNAKQYFGF